MCSLVMKVKLAGVTSITAIAKKAKNSTTTTTTNNSNSNNSCRSDVPQKAARADLKKDTQLTRKRLGYVRLGLLVNCRVLPDLTFSVRVTCFLLSLFVTVVVVVVLNLSTAAVAAVIFAVNLLCITVACCFFMLVVYCLLCSLLGVVSHSCSFEQRKITPRPP